MQAICTLKFCTITEDEVKPCSLGYLFVLAPIHHPSHHPSHQVSWHQDQGCVVACPNPLAYYLLGHQSFPCHPSHLASWPQDPKRRKLYLSLYMKRFYYFYKQYQNMTS